MSAASLRLLDRASVPALLGRELLSLSDVFSMSSTNQASRFVGLAKPFAALAISYYLWGEGRRTGQLQRPVGSVFGQFLILEGVAQCLFRRMQHGSPGRMSGEDSIALTSMVIGGVILSCVVPPFLRSREQHRILEHMNKWGESIQAEYHSPTPECPFPERWQMFDPMSAEVEVLEFLKCLITTVKPELVVETGTFMGLSTLYMAAGMKKNGFGKIITCESDPIIFIRAKRRVETSGLGDWIELRNESSLRMRVSGRIDLLFSDTHSPIREQEVRRFLPQVKPSGLILMHDANSHSKIVREAAMKLEREGLVSPIFLPTPRGLCIAQKR